VVWIVIGVGGGLGAMARHGVNHLVAARFGAGFPAGTFVVNAVGCFAIGVIAGLIAATRIQISELTRYFLVVGVLGGFTTFSSYGLDTFTLIRGGHTMPALVNATGQVLVGLTAVWLGYAAAAGRV
jgi:fluoride exporter